MLCYPPASLPAAPRHEDSRVLRIVDLGIIALCLVLASTASVRAQRPEEIFFETKVRPVLAERCFRCHGGKKVSHGLRVDSRSALLNGGENGPAIIPGSPDRSLLIQ